MATVLTKEEMINEKTNLRLQITETKWIHTGLEIIKASIKSAFNVPSLEGFVWKIPPPLKPLDVTGKPFFDFQPFGLEFFLQVLPFLVSRPENDFTIGFFSSGPAW